MIYLILGMHKSGTTLLSQILHESGIPMGEFDASKGYDEGNKYERRETHDLNIAMLGYDYHEHSMNIAKVLDGPERISLDMEQKIRAVIQVTGERHPDWGFKDPRTCLTYHVWKAFLPEHKIIAVFRHPLELWMHYKRQRSWLAFWPFWACWKATYAWYVHNKEILRVIRSTPHPVFCCEYHEFMSKPDKFQQLCMFTGRALQDSRKTALYRSRKHHDTTFRLVLWIHKRFFSRDLIGLYEELKQQPVTSYVADTT